MTIHEQSLIDWLGRREWQHDRLRLGIGDDMAIINLPDGGTVLLSSDMLLDGVHFNTADHDPAAIGHKCLACGLSDCAAMAVRPVAATVSLALPKQWDPSAAERLMDGIAATAAKFDVAIAGGDTTTWNKPLAVDVAVCAVPYPGIDPVRRSGAVVGDAIFVTGRLGGSGAGRHLTFTPRVRESQRIASALGPYLHAMIDVSDGLSLDLSRVCAASGVGALLEEGLLTKVASDDAHRAADEDGADALDHVLSDGEDFELLLVAEERAEPQSGHRAADPAGGVKLYRLGRIVEKPGLSLRRIDGCVEPIEPRGYVH